MKKTRHDKPLELRLWSNQSWKSSSAALAAVELRDCNVGALTPAQGQQNLAAKTDRRPRRSSSTANEDKKNRSESDRRPASVTRRQLCRYDTRLIRRTRFMLASNEIEAHQLSRIGQADRPSVEGRPGNGLPLERRKRLSASRHRREHYAASAANRLRQIDCR